MKTKANLLQETQAILAKLKGMRAELFQKYPLKRIALFGSYARGEQGDVSDIDILVDVDPTIGMRIVELADDLEKEFQRPVDLVSMRAIPSNRLKSIEGEVLYV